MLFKSYSLIPPTFFTVDVLLMLHCVTKFVVESRNQTLCVVTPLSTCKLNC